MSSAVYTELIQQHATTPKNAEPYVGAKIIKTAISRTCGDSVVLACDVEEGVVTKMAMMTQGCSLCRASSSILTTKVLGRPLIEVLLTVKLFQWKLISGEPIDDPELSALLAVRSMPHRVKCVAMPWDLVMQSLRPNTPPESLVPGGLSRF